MLGLNQQPLAWPRAPRGEGAIQMSVVVVVIVDVVVIIIIIVIIILSS